VVPAARTSNISLESAVVIGARQHAARSRRRKKIAGTVATGPALRKSVDYCFGGIRGSIFFAISCDC
jgi:hypothetical protein